MSSVTPSTLSLYRNNTNATYPYNYSNIASIISSTNGSTDSYFYFYNWDISTISCSSEKSEAVVFIDQCVGIEKINYSESTSIFFESPKVVIRGTSISCQVNIWLLVISIETFQY